MSSTVKNTHFNNLVNYETSHNSANNPQAFDYSSIDPTCLSNLSKEQQIVEYHIIEVLENKVAEQ